MELENNHKVEKPLNFSSTVNLVDNEVQEKQNESYKPFEHRNYDKATSISGSFFHLLKSSLGSGILAMPNAFKNSGLAFGAVGTIVVGFICTYCVHLLVKVSQEICVKVKKPVLSFSETAEAAFNTGPPTMAKFAVPAKITVDTFLVFTYFMGNSVYIVFVATSLKEVFDHWYPDYEISKTWYIVMVMGCLLIASQVRELKYLVPYSFFANVFIVISFAITLYYVFQDIPSVSTVDQFTEFSKLPIFFSTVIFAMEGIGVVLPVENNMKNPKRFLGCPGVLNVAMILVVFLYGTVGFFGYLKYGNLTEASITINLPIKEVPAQLVKVFIAISVFLTYNLQLYVPTDILWRSFLGKYADTDTKRHLIQVSMRVIFVVGTTAIALAVPNLELIIGLVGSICFSTLGLLIPAVIDSAWRWSGSNLGVFKWHLIKNVLLGLFSLFALFAGTAQTISGMLSEDNK